MDYQITAMRAEHLVHVATLNSLLRQLSSSAPMMDKSGWAALLDCPTTKVYLAINPSDGAPAGMLTLCITLSPTGRKCWIEDVVVDERLRGCGLGRALVDHAIDEAGRLAPATLMLTSRPSRVAANSLYNSMGFIKKETNVYKMALTV